MTDLTPELATILARRFTVLGEATRLRLLALINDRGEATVTELVEATGSTQANVSKHLGVLLGERMVIRRRAGSHAFYRIADPALIDLCDQVCAGVRDELRELSLVVGEAEVRA
jgi:DNA-binding transcriptional ArsR family regulator